jgi:hypothetical protein
MLSSHQLDLVGSDCHSNCDHFIDFVFGRTILPRHGKAELSSRLAPGAKGCTKRNQVFRLGVNYALPVDEGEELIVAIHRVEHINDPLSF